MSGLVTMRVLVTMRALVTMRVRRSGSFSLCGLQTATALGRLARKLGKAVWVYLLQRLKSMCACYIQEVWGQMSAQPCNCCAEDRNKHMSTGLAIAGTARHCLLQL